MTSGPWSSPRSAPVWWSPFRGGPRDRYALARGGVSDPALPPGQLAGVAERLLPAEGSAPRRRACTPPEGTRSDKDQLLGQPSAGTRSFPLAAPRRRSPVHHRAWPSPVETSTRSASLRLGGHDAMVVERGGTQDWQLRAPAARSRLVQQTDVVVLVPGISEAIGPAIGVAGDPQSPVQRPPGALALVVAADIVAKEVVGEQHIAAPAADLHGLGQFDVRMPARGGEGPGAADGEEGSVEVVGCPARPTDCRRCR